MRTCKAPNCSTRFEAKGFVVWCSPACGSIIAQGRLAKKKAKQAKEEKKQDRVRKEKLKTRSDYIKEAQHEFNRYIRLRDAGLPCICCGEPLGADAIGGGYDCGHWRSTGSAPHLRFHEDNAHGQRKYCNRYGAGRAVDYRIGLVKRIGLERVESLERDQQPRHYSTDELKAIKAKYKALAKELEK
jgi:NinG protein